MALIQFVVVMLSACLLIFLFSLKANSVEILSLDKPSPEIIVKQSTLNNLHVPDQFTLLSWNIQKAQADGFAHDFNNLRGSLDFMLLQESYLSDSFLNLLDGWQNYQLATVEAWRKGDVPIGVSLLSKAQPLLHIPYLSEKEPFVLLRKPKSSLISYYRFRNGQTLMIINFHGLLMTRGSKYKRQLEEVILPALSHDGPIICAGDFNTWRQSSWQTLEYLKESLGLSEVIIENDPRDPNKRMGGKKAMLDHIFYRGLRVIGSQVLSHIETSDHYPLYAEFELEDIEL